VVALEFFARPYQWGIPVDRVADLHLDTVQLLQSSTYGVTALLMLAVAAHATRRRRRRSEPEAVPAAT
jgi:MYXO-CTERM domain-containing protein